MRTMKIEKSKFNILKLSQSEKDEIVHREDDNYFYIKRKKFEEILKQKKINRNVFINYFKNNISDLKFNFFVFYSKYLKKKKHYFMFRYNEEFINKLKDQLNYLGYETENFNNKNIVEFYLMVTIKKIDKEMQNKEMQNKE